MALLTTLGLTPTVNVAKAIAAASGPDPKAAAQAALADFDKALKGAVAFAAQIKDKAAQTKFVQALTAADAMKRAASKAAADQQREAAQKALADLTAAKEAADKAIADDLQGRGEEDPGPGPGDAQARLRRLVQARGSAEGALRQAQGARQEGPGRGPSSKPPRARSTRRSTRRTARWSRRRPT